jgi:uncharacterized Zn-binding protein involved in type VI secretion
MPAATRADGVDSVASATGSGDLCASPMTTATDTGSGNTFVNNHGAVRLGTDTVASHPMTGCGSEAPTLSTASSNVFVNGKGMSRLGDNYAGDGSNIITSGSSNVFVNG